MFQAEERLSRSQGTLVIRMSKSCPARPGHSDAETFTRLASA